MSASNWIDAVPVAAQPAAEKTEAARWSIAKRIAFRFTFAYLLLYNLPFPFEVIPATEPYAQKYYFDVWTTVTQAVARQVFGVPADILPAGSGDTTFNYVQLFCYVVLAAAVTVVWSLLDRRRASYTRLHEWLRLYIRFALGATMVSYGAFKVIQAQFPPPSLDRLLQPFGDASPMGILWTFMGASAAYNVFTGASEILGGVLLMFRRTVLLGAVVSAAVLANIVALNFFYDVPVKQYSLHLLAMATFLAAPDLRRMIEFFILHRPPDLFSAKWLRVAGMVLRTAVVIVVVVFMLARSRKAAGPANAPPPRSPLYGIWNVDSLTVNGVERPPLITDAKRWRRLVFDRPQVVAIQTMDDHRQRYFLALDENNGTMNLKKREEKSSVSLEYRRPDPNTLIVDGIMGGETLHATMHRGEVPKFLLTTRGFHWINEYPFNR